MPRELLDALDGHVRRAALDAGDDELAAALLDLHDELLRAARSRHGTGAARAALDALAGLIPL